MIKFLLAGSLVMGAAAVACGDGDEGEVRVPEGAFAVARAVAEEDTEGLLAHVDWQPYRCGLRNSEGCPSGSEIGTELPMVNSGWPVAFYVTADHLRPTISALVEDALLDLSYAMHLPDLGIVYVAFEGATPIREPLAGGMPEDVVGFFLNLDTSSIQPIAEIAWLVETWSAQQQAEELNLPGEGDPDLLEALS